MLRILHVFPQMNNAGTEMVIMNIYKNIDRNKIQFDFLVQKKGYFDDEIIKMGGRIHYLNKSLNYYKELKKFFSEHNYSHIHVHTQRWMGLILKAGNKAGIQFRIAHSHNSRLDLPYLMKLYKRTTTKGIEKNANVLLACSSSAAEWLFPRNFENAKIIKNPINIEKFEFDIEKRRSFRKSYKISNKTKIVCHVGRFAKQKNHRFIIELAKEILNIEEDTIFVLVGTGPLEKEIKDLVIKSNIEDKVLFLGNKNNIDEILSAADIFILPSIHEGLGIVLLEAQASGLHCIVSERVPCEADMKIGLFSKLSLLDGVNVWVEKVQEKLFVENNRLFKSKSAQVSIYNISNNIKEIESVYIDKGKGNV